MPKTEISANASGATENALPFWNRPAYKGKDVTLALTDDQKAARQTFADDLSAALSKPGALKALGGFMTLSNDQTSMLVALTLTVPAITVENPQGHEITTRPFVLNINAGLAAADSDKKEEIAPSALTWDQIQATMAEAKKAKKAK